MSRNLQRVVLASALFGAIALIFACRDRVDVAVPFALVLLAAGAFLPRLIGKLRQQSWLDVDELKRRTDAAEDLLVVDVRTPDDFVGEQGHLTFARNLPLEDLGGRVDELGDDPQRPIAIVCRTDRRSAKAAALLAKRGFSDARVVRGGMTAWLERGWPIAPMRVDVRASMSCAGSGSPGLP